MHAQLLKVRKSERFTWLATVGTLYGTCILMLSWLLCCAPSLDHFSCLWRSVLNHDWAHVTYWSNTLLTLCIVSREIYAIHNRMHVKSGLSGSQGARQPYFPQRLGYYNIVVCIMLNFLGVSSWVYSILLCCLLSTLHESWGGIYDLDYLPTNAKMLPMNMIVLIGQNHDLESIIFWNILLTWNNLLKRY